MQPVDIQLLISGQLWAGVAFERPHEDGEWERYFGFWTPSAYAQRVTPDDPVASKTNNWWLTKEFIEDGFISISDESDGDEWLISIAGNATSPVYLYDLSARQRKLVSDRMASFLASFQICKNQDW